MTRQNHQSKIVKWLPRLALLLIIAGQLYYLPDRFDFFKQLLVFAGAANGTEKVRLAYHPADYDLLEWVRQITPAKTTLLLLTANPRTYGDPSYILYHRAIYHLAPRSVWWAAPAPATRYPAWWSFADFSETDILIIARQYQVDVILADGLTEPPVSGPVASFDEDTHLIFLDDAGPKRHLSSVVHRQSPIVQDGWLTFVKMVGGLLSILVWGEVLSQYLGCSLLPPSLAQRLAIDWLLGCGLTSLATFVLLWIGVSLAAAVFGLSLTGLLLWLLLVMRETRPIKEKLHTLRHTLHNTPYALRPMKVASLNLWSTLFALILLIQMSLIAFAVLVRPLIDWDAWVNWAGKANLLFVERTISPNIYNNPARLPTNLDYPLMLPLLEAWGYTWLDQIHEPLAGGITVLFYLALLLLFYHVARRSVSPTTALGFTAFLATVPRLERLAHSGLADVPLAAILLSAFALLLAYLDGIDKPAGRRDGLVVIVMLGLTTGLLPWLKNEGWLWLGVITLCWLVGVGRQVRRGILSARQAVVLTLCYGTVALTIPLLWQLFLNINGTQRFTFLSLTWSNLWTHLHRYPLIVLEIGKRLLNPYWNFIWPLIGLTLLLRRGKIFQSVTGWLILPIGGYLVLVSATYVFSRFDPYLAHLNNSVERLTLQAVPLAVWWLVGQYHEIGD